MLNKNIPKYKDKDWLYTQYWVEKKNMREIAESVGVTKSTIRIWMNRFGIKTRNNSEYKKLRYEKMHSKNKYHNKEILYDMHWKQGLSIREIASITGIGRGTIRNWMEKFGISRRNQQQSCANYQKRSWKDKPYTDKDWLYDKYWNKGMSGSEIGELVGVNGRLILSWMKKLGVERRSDSDALDLKYYIFDDDGNVVKKKCGRCHKFISLDRFDKSKTLKYGVGEYCKSCARRIREEQRRGLGYIELNEWFEGSEGHHVTNDYVLHIPREIHRKCTYPDREIHRVLVFNELVYQHRLDDIDLILGIYGTNLDEIGERKEVILL